jgi:hypothetical protein
MWYMTPRFNTTSHCLPGSNSSTSPTSKWDVGNAVVLGEELRLRDVLCSEVEAVDVFGAATGHVDTEEPAVASDIEHRRVGYLLAEQRADSAVDEVTSVARRP